MSFVFVLLIEDSINVYLKSVVSAKDNISLEKSAGICEFLFIKHFRNG